MNTQAALPIALAPPGALPNLAAIARRELRDALRSRWFLHYAIVFVALGLGISYISSLSAGVSGLAGFGRTTAGLINLVLLVAPLMALSAGAGSIASDRERGMLAYLLAQPVARCEVLLGKYLGLAAALAACICLGLGLCAAILAARGAGASPVALLRLAGLSITLALAMLSLGLLISTIARKASIATGIAIFVWLVLVFVTDLGLMAATVAMRLRIEQLFAISLLNPLQVYKMWSLHASETSIDVLGSAGLYAVEEYGPNLHLIFAAALGAWIPLPLALAAWIFSRRSAV